VSATCRNSDRVTLLEQKECIMSQAERFDVLVLGSGEGGKYLAWHLAQSGQRTAVVERQWIGGSCPNINCLPSKNEIWSAKVADLVRRASEFGVVTAWTRAATSRSTSAWRPPRRRSGRWGSVPAVPSSPTSPSTTSGLSATIWRGATGPRAIESSPSACSPTHRSPVSA
jgi:hypothetical protein